MRKALVIGDALLDQYIYASSFRMSPEDPTCKIWDQRRLETKAGGALNVAANFTQLTHYPVEYAGILDSRWYKHELMLEHSIVTSPLCVETNRPIFKTRLMDETSGKQILRIDNQATFSGRDIAEFNERLRTDGRLLGHYNIIVVSDYLKGTVSNVLIEALEEHAGPTPIIVDTKRPDLSLWRRLQHCYVKINQKEYDASVNASSVNHIVTYGAGGAQFCPKKDSIFEQYAVQGKDTAISHAGVIGAGDAFLAGFAANYVQYVDVESAMRYADLTARAYVRVPGTNTVTLADVERERQSDDQRHTWYYDRQN